MNGRPDAIQPLAIEDLERLGLNADHELFWDGKRIEIRRALVLTGLQKFFAVTVSICAILGGLGGFASGLNNGSLFLCARNVTWLGCPPSLPSASASPATLASGTVKP